MSVTLLY